MNDRRNSAGVDIVARRDLKLSDVQAGSATGDSSRKTKGDDPKGRRLLFVRLCQAI